MKNRAFMVIVCGTFSWLDPLSVELFHCRKHEGNARQKVTISSLKNDLIEMEERKRNQL